MYFLLLVAAKTDVFMPVRIDKLPSGACIIHIRRQFVYL